MIYRPATIWELTEVGRLWAEMVKDIDKIAIEDPMPEMYLREIFESYGSITTIVYIAEDPETNNIIGFISGEIGAIPYTKRLTCHGEALYVKPEYRNKGVNFKLMEEFIKEALTRDVDKLIDHIEFDTSFKGAPIKAYERMGFEPVQLRYRKEVNNEQP